MSGMCLVESHHQFVTRCVSCGYRDDDKMVEIAALDTLDVILSGSDDVEIPISLYVAMDCCNLEPALTESFLLEMYKHVTSGDIVESVVNGIPAWSPADKS